MHSKKTKTIFPGNQMSRVRFSRLQGGRGYMHTGIQSTQLLRVREWLCVIK